MGILRQDLVFALRMLRKSPGFACIAILSLALGIGANTAIFSFVNALLLRPLALEKSEELAMLYTNSSDTPFGGLSYLDFADLRQRNDVFSQTAAFETTLVSLGFGDDTRFLAAGIVTGNYFDTLGVGMERGRGFLPQEDTTPLAAPVAVLGYRAWQRNFQGDPEIIGKTIALNGNHYTVVGIASRNHTGMVRGFTVDVWVPMMMQKQVRSPGTDLLNVRGRRWLSAIGRLKPGVSFEQAEANLKVLSQQWEKEFPETNRGLSFVLKPANRVTIHPKADLGLYFFSLLLLSLVGMVLLIACANLMGLLLARGVARQREVAVRLALGASRGRLVRQFLTETTVLALAGGALGFLAAVWTTNLLSSTLAGVHLPVPIEITLNAQPDARVFFFALLISVAAGIVSGLAPALQTVRASLVPSLKDEGWGTTSGSRRSRLRSGLVVGQVALAMVLLIGAGLCVRSLANAQSMDPGFRTEGIYVATLDLGLRGYSDASGRAFYAQLLERLNAHPEISSASFVVHVPMTLSLRTQSVRKEGEMDSAAELETGTTTVAPRYFETMGIPLLRGRDFSASDSATSPRVLVVNETAARRIWPGEEALGKRLYLGANDKAGAEVIGIVRDAKYQSLGETQRIFIYQSFQQRYEADVTVIAHSRGESAAATGALRSTVRELDPALPIYAVEPLEQRLGISLFVPRVTAAVLGAFGALGLALALVGIYGMISFAVSQRTHEIGIRMALGAQPSDVLLLVLRQGFILSGVGITIGFAAALGITRFLSTLLYGISPTDAITFAVVPALLLSAALLACYLPARRATRVDPLSSLRYE